jgi:hypothetical protein
LPQWASTLLAVFVGGLLTYLTQRLLEDRRSEVERQRETDLASAELRVAMRLALDELDSIALHYAMVAERGQYPEPQDREHWGCCSRPRPGKPISERSPPDCPDDQWSEFAVVMHASRRARIVLLRGEPLTPIPPELVRMFQRGAEISKQLYESIAGTTPPSVATNERR